MNIQPDSGPGYKPPWMEQAPVSPSPVPPPPVNGSPANAGEVPNEPSPNIAPARSIFGKIIPFAAIAILVLVIFFVARLILTKKGNLFQPGSSPVANQNNKEVTLTYWGLWESDQVMAPILAEYKKDHPKVTINYVFQSSKDYRERLQSALAAGKGPDIFRIHNTWLAMFKTELAPVPDNLVDWSDYYPAVSSLKLMDKYYAVPLEIDTLALYCNNDLLKAAGKEPPTSWKELRETALVLRTAANNKIQIGGIALGLTANVDNWSDILALMLMQNGVDLTRPSGKLAEDTLSFYTRFSAVDGVWDATLPSSVYAFATGKVAMIFAPSWRAFEIKEVNPNLNFRTVPVPQLSGTQITWASFWAEAVSAKASDSQAAWDFIKFLSQKETLKKLYSLETKVRLFGEPYPLKSLASQLETDPIVGAFVKQAPYAKSWYLSSETHDNGINDRMIKYFEDMVNAGGTAESLTQLSNGVSQILNQYQLLSQPVQ